MKQRCDKNTPNIFPKFMLGYKFYRKHKKNKSRYLSNKIYAGL